MQTSSSISNSYANATPPGNWAPTGPGPVSSVSNSSFGHGITTVTKQGVSGSKSKKGIDTDAKIPRSHALQKGVNSNPVGFYSEMCHSMIQSQSRPLKSGGKSAVRGKSSAYDIVAELAREKSHCNHLDAPKPAVAHFGPEPEDLMAWYVDLARKAKKEFEEREMANGTVYRAKQRSSTAIIMVALASYPGSSDHNDDRYNEWIEFNIEFAKKKFGKRLVGIYEHTDEQHGHLHILVADEGRPVKPFMTGERVFNQTLKAGGSRKQAGDAKNKANSGLLDAYFEHVNKPLGIARKNAKPRARMSWKAAKTEQLKNVEVVQEEERARLKAARLKKSDKTLEVESESARLFREKHRLIDLKSEQDRALKAREEKAALREVKMADRESVLDAKDAENKAKLDRVILDNQALKRAFDAIEKYVPAEMKKEARQAAMDSFHAIEKSDKKIKPH